MKKIIALCAVLGLALMFGACERLNITYTPDEPTAQAEQTQPPESEQTEPEQTEPEQAEPEESRELELGITFTMITTSISVYESGDSRAEYLVVSGLSDPVAEEELNLELYMFSTWALGSFASPDYVPDEDEPTITSTLEYAIVGDFLSVRQVVTSYTEGAAHPVTMLETRTLDMTTGFHAGPLTDFIIVGDELRELITSGVFVQVYPAEIDGALERLAVEIVDNHNPEYYDGRFYLTEDTFGLYIETLHVEGGYWAFEAPFEDILDVLTGRLSEAVEEWIW